MATTSMNSDGDARVRAALGQWRDSLVNLSGNNRLLNYRKLKTTFEFSFLGLRRTSIPAGLTSRFNRCARQESNPTGAMYTVCRLWGLESLTRTSS